MLKIFRRIRQKLLNQGNITKYLVYAIGEILLVMIGILLALQVNNLNESRKDETKRINYLKGIVFDLEADLNQVNRCIDLYENRFIQYKRINPNFVIDTTGFHQERSGELITRQLFQRSLTVRPQKATYNSMVSSGDIGLIKNKELLNNLQRLYETDMNGINSIYETIKLREEHIGWKYAYEMQNLTIEDIKNKEDQNFFADMNFYHEGFIRFHRVLNLIEEHINQILKSIKLELEK